MIRLIDRLIKRWNAWRNSRRSIAAVDSNEYTRAYAKEAIDLMSQANVSTLTDLAARMYEINKTRELSGADISKWVSEQKTK